MALLGQTKPEDILGMSQEEFKKKLDGGATKEDLAALAVENQKTASSLDEIKAALAALKPPAVPDPDPDPTDPSIAMLQDPQGFVRKELKPLQQSQLETQAALQEMRARQDPALARAFQDYGPEMIKLAATMPLDVRARANFWEWHVRTYLGDMAMKGTLKSPSYPALIGTSSIAPGSPDNPDPGANMTPEMREYYKKRGIPLDRAAHIMKLMDDGEQISMQTVKGTGNA